MSSGPLLGPVEAPEDGVPTLGAIVVAAGSSTRMAGIDKVFTPLLGMPLIAHCLDQLETFAPVTQIALVLSQPSLALGEELVANRKYTKVSSVCAGGASRQDSVRIGLEALGTCNWVLVHDGARPCLDHALLERGWDAVKGWGAALAGVPVKDTIKVVSPERTVLETPPREALWAAQTPQFFRYGLLQQAHQQARQQDWEPATDDAAMVEKLGHPVQVFMGSYENLKITTPDDLTLAEALLTRRYAENPVPGSGLK